MAGSWFDFDLDGYVGRWIDLWVCDWVGGLWVGRTGGQIERYRVEWVEKWVG